MTNILDLEDELSIFKYLLSDDVYEIEKPYIDSIAKLDEMINIHLDKQKICILCEQNNIFNIDSEWINSKYRELIQHQMNIDLITPRIINFMEKSVK
jgi:hypothetical protein